LKAPQGLLPAFPHSVDPLIKQEDAKGEIRKSTTSDKGPIIQSDAAVSLQPASESIFLGLKVDPPMINPIGLHRSTGRSDNLSKSRTKHNTYGHNQHSCLFAAKFHGILSQCHRIFLLLKGDK